MKIFRKTLKQKSRRVGTELTLVVNSDRRSALDENWKRVFADIQSSLEFSLDAPAAFPHHIDVYVGDRRATVESEGDPGDSVLREPAAADFLTHLKPAATMDELVIPDTLRKEIEEIVFYCGHKAEIDRQIDPAGRKRRGVFINFHGDSGTGKTLAAEIIAGRLGEDLYVVNYANLESELVGRTSKNIHAIFALAKTRETVLMFDEADSFLSARITDLQQSADYGINTSRSQLLKELDAYDGVVIFATNHIVNYDVAFQTRFDYNIHFPLPDAGARLQILDKHCRSDRLAENLDRAKLAEEMDGFSGRDIQTVVRRAVIEGMREILGGSADRIAQGHFEQAIAAVQASKKAFLGSAARAVPLRAIGAMPNEEAFSQPAQRLE